jgi:hypothetical protein
MELLQKRQQALGGPACGLLPIEALGAQRQRAKQGGTVPLGWRRDVDVLALTKPATLDVGFIRKMGCIDKADFYRSLRLVAPDGGDNCCRPRLFFSAVGAFRGTVLAKRL